MPRERKPISDAAINKATGKSREQWFRLLDRKGAKKLAHKEIARMLSDQGHIESGWWCQMITVEYEYARGKRTVGETASAGFEIGVTKTVSAPDKQVWEFLMSPAGRNIWLGDVGPLKLVPKESFKTKEGTIGEIRTLKSGERIRLVWQPKGFKNPSTLQMTVSRRPSAGGTQITFHQEKLTSAKQREAMRRHWQTVLERIDHSLES